MDEIIKQAKIEERSRIIQVFREKAAERNIFESLSYPYLFEELLEMIMEGQDD